jgi:hypothetical protein
MRFLKHTVISIVIAIVIVAAYMALFLFTPPSPGSIDKDAVKRINTLCGSRADCNITLRDIFKGDWDTYYEFSYSVNQTTVNQVLGNQSVRVSDLQRILIFTKDGKIVRKGYGDSGQGQPLANEIEFSGTYEKGTEGWVKYDSDAKFKVIPCSTKEGGKLGGPYGGTYYLLVLLPIQQEYTTECAMPGG